MGREIIIREHNKRDNIIYEKDSIGHEEWYKFDENNNIIHYKNSSGYEDWHKYDENNKRMYCKGFNDLCYSEYWKKYNSSGKCIEKLEKTVYKV